jgi:hypothetical protein
VLKLINVLKHTYFKNECHFSVLYVHNIPSSPSMTVYSRECNLLCVNGTELIHGVISSKCARFESPDTLSYIL